MQVHDCIWQKLYESINFCNDANDHGLFPNGKRLKLKKKKINAIHRTIAFTMNSNRFSSANAFRNLMEIKANKDRSVPNTKDTVVEPEKELDPVFSQLLDRGIDLEEVIANDRKRLDIPDDLVLSEDHRIYLAKKLLELEELRETVNHGLALHESNYLYKSDNKRGVVSESSSSGSSGDSGSVNCSNLTSNSIPICYPCRGITKTEFTSGSASGSTSYSWDEYEGPIQNQGKTNLCYLYAAYGVTEYLVGQEFGTSGTVFSPTKANTCLGVAETCTDGAALDKGLELLCGGAYQDQMEDCNNLDTNASISQTVSQTVSEQYNYIFTNAYEPTIDDIDTMIDNLNISPIIIGIDGSSNSIQHYHSTSGEPLTPLCTTYYDHAVVIVGYDESTNLFKVRNSWGKSWGDNGYFYLDAIPGNYGLGRAYIYNITLVPNEKKNAKCPDFTKGNRQSCSSSSTGSALTETGAVETGASAVNCCGINVKCSTCNVRCTVTEWQRYCPLKLFQANMSGEIPCYPNLQLDDGTKFTYPDMTNYTYDGSAGWTTSVIKSNDKQIFTQNILNILQANPVTYYYYTDLWDLTNDPPTSTICTSPTQLSKSANTSGTLQELKLDVLISDTTYPQYWYTDDTTQTSKSFYMLFGNGYVALFFSDGTMTVVGDYSSNTKKTIKMNSSYSMRISTNIPTSPTAEYTATYKITLGNLSF